MKDLVNDYTGKSHRLFSEQCQHPLIKTSWTMRPATPGLGNLISARSVRHTHTHIHTHPSPTSRQVSTEKEQFSPWGGSLMGGLSWLPMVGSSLIYSLLCLWIQSTPPTLVLQKLLQYKLVLAALDFHVNDSYVRLLPFSKLLFWFIPVVCCLLSRVLYLIVEHYEFFVTCFSVLLWAGTRGISRFY